MANTDIETIILELMDENLVTADNWDGEGELREALGDAIDELCFREGFFERKALLPLRANVAFYSFSLADAYPLWIKNVRLVGDDERPITQTTLNRLKREDPRWLLSTGSPYQYIPFGHRMVTVYPHPASDGSTIELTLCCSPKKYKDETLFYSPKKDFEDALVAYGKYYLLMRSTGNDEGAMREYQNYLALAGDSHALAHHKQSTRTYYLKQRGQENWPQ